MDWQNSIIFKIISRGLGVAITYFIFRFLWWKGILGILIGMTLIIYLLASKNMMLRMVVTMLGGNDTYNKEIMGNEKETINKK